MVAVYVLPESSFGAAEQSSLAPPLVLDSVVVAGVADPSSLPPPQPATSTTAASARIGSAMRLRLDIEYDGTEFSGWAAQPGFRTVEGTLREALGRLYAGFDGLAVA